MKTKDLLHAICEMRIRFCRVGGEWYIWAHTDEEANAVLCSIQRSTTVRDGTEGYVSLRQLGLVQHHYLLRIGRSLVRILSPAVHPGGMFSPRPPESLTLERMAT